jgi:hypothetical protein
MRPSDEFPNENWTVREAHDWLWARIEKGAPCPCCGQFAKIYYRRINFSMLKALGNLYKAARRGHTRDGFEHLPPIDPSHGEAARLAYWGLIEEEPGFRLDGGRKGWWRPTDKGMDFLRGGLWVPSYARVYDSKLLALLGRPWSARDALKEGFDLRRLMEGPFDE